MHNKMHNKIEVISNAVMLALAAIAIAYLVISTSFVLGKNKGRDEGYESGYEAGYDSGVNSLRYMVGEDEDAAEYLKTLGLEI